jgi:hypothetical protein
MTPTLLAIRVMAGRSPGHPRFAGQCEDGQEKPGHDDRELGWVNLFADWYNAAHRPFAVPAGEDRLAPRDAQDYRIAWGVRVMR